eukprot:10450729-Heterocapsa_arctica.AAC.1
MVIARALPDSPVSLFTLLSDPFTLLIDPLDMFGSKCCCASDGDSEGSPRWPFTSENTNKQNH